MHADATHKPGVQLDWLKSLTNRTHLSYILIGNFSLYDFCHLNGQVARRMGDEHFPRYHLDRQRECGDFIGALKLLLKQVPLQVDIPEMLTYWQWFGEWSIGCVGILSDWVVETVVTLCRAGETTLTLEALTEHALKPDQRLRLETEARTGEFKIEQAKAQSAKELQQLLGKPSTIPNRQPGRHMEASGAALHPTPPKTHPSSRIERAAHRDPVGEQVLTGNVTKCSYIGIIEVTRHHF